MKVLLTFTHDVSLEKWESDGIIYREVSLYKELSKKNVDVSFLTYGTNEDLKYSDLLGDIKVYPVFNYIKSKSWVLQLIKSLFIPLKLKNVIKEIDIIKTNQINGSWISCISKILFKKRIIIRSGFEWLYGHRTFFNKKGIKQYIKYLLRYVYIFIIELISYKMADRIIMTGDYDIPFIVKCFKLKRKLKKNKIRLFYNYIDENLFKPALEKKKDKHVLFIGRLSYEKNLFNLLEAFKELDGFVLDIIGTGPEEEKLKNKAKQIGINANFLGIIPNNEIPEKLNQYQIFILPSLSEGNPKALLEAMSCGVACIGTNVKGINNIIKHKQNGYLCEKTSNSIKEAILTIYRDINLRKKIEGNARKFILENCSLNSIVQKEFLLYQEIF
jgi:glycosyltransferase involved in cell wall biosynthesis